MIITLNEREIEHACLRYVQRKNAEDTPNHVYTAVLHRGHRFTTCTVTITPKEAAPGGAAETTAPQGSAPTR